MNPDTMDGKSWSYETLLGQLEKKKLMVEKAQELHNQLSKRIDERKRRLSEIKMERFKLEGAAEELEMRTSALKLREKELRKVDEETEPKIVKEAFRKRKDFFKDQNEFDDKLADKVLKMAEDYRQIKKSSGKDAILSDLQRLFEIEQSIDKEIGIVHQIKTTPTTVIDDNWVKSEGISLVKILTRQEDEKIIQDVEMLINYVAKEIKTGRNENLRLENELVKVNVEIMSLTEEMSLTNVSTVAQ